MNLTAFKNLSTTGLVLGGAFLLASTFLILTQGLFGESFIALILGMPWVLVLSYFEFFNPTSTTVLAALLILPIIVNALLLYGLGVLFDWVQSRSGWFQKT